MLTVSQRQAIITLLHKKDKDRLFIINWRPISLLNVDYKLLTKCLTQRLKGVIDKLVDISQSGFIQNRNIRDSMRTVIDIFEDYNTNNKPGIMISVDFEKAYDTVS